MAGVSERCIGCDARGLIRWNLSWGERGGWNQRRGGEESGDDESKLRWSTVVDVDESGLRQKLLRQDMTAKFEKLDKFEGNDFRRWQKKIHFLLTTLKVVYVLSSPMLEFVEDEMLEQTRK
ncbi:hypothetical protein Tco_1101838 [Tanacetum coccineum]